MSIKSRADGLLRRTVPAYRARRKYEDELQYWKGELKNLREWFVEGTTDWWGITAPTPEQKVVGQALWEVDAIYTMHKMRPSYSEELRLPIDHFTNQRVLEVGCGPLIPLLQFTNCERHALDPLASMYMEAGWPLYAYDAKVMTSPGEKMPYADEYFDSVISVNALDHVDNFESVASEMIRVLKPGGYLYFEVEYHHPTVTEPITLDDNRIMAAFRGCQLNSVVSRTGREMFEAMVKRFDLIPNRFDRFGNEKFVTWHAKKTIRKGSDVWGS
jgi:SAM-dependent methyltransferase